MSKSIFTSKTFWVNVAIAAYAGVSQYISSLPSDGADLVIVTAIINIINRLFTEKPVHII